MISSQFRAWFENSFFKAVRGFLRRKVLPEKALLLTNITPQATAVKKN